MITIKEKLTKTNFYSGNGTKVNRFIVIHYVGAVSTAENNANYFYEINRQASANYFVDDNEIYRVVRDEDSAWHCGTNGIYYSECRNTNSIGIEMCCYMNNGVLDVSKATEQNTIELTKQLMEKYNIPVENVIRHYDVTRKICPAPFVNDPVRWDNFKKALGGNTSTTINNSELKDYDTVVNEVIAGKWGNGSDRVNNLIAAGYSSQDVEIIQNKVNERYGIAPVTTNTKSVNELADEVIAGKWGTGKDRKNALEAAGYNYQEVQNEVNRRYGIYNSSAPTKDYDTVVNEVIVGKWGNGSDRKNALAAAGYNDTEIKYIQDRVNERYGM